MVVGAPKREKDPRLSCKLWEEPKGPDFVLEVVSRGTWRVDRDEKPKVYAKPGGGGVLAVRPDGGASGVADPGDAAGRRQVPGLAAGGVAVRCAEAAQCGTGARCGRGPRRSRHSSSWSLRSSYPRHSPITRCLTNDSTVCSMRSGSRWSAKHSLIRPNTRVRFSTSRNSTAPASEVISPPSNRPTTSRESKS